MIELKDMQVKYGDFVALNDINLQVKEHEFFTLLGPSGCGKTTTLRAIAGFLEPSKGDIIVNDERMNDIPSEKRGIGMVFQSYALFPTMTVAENIAFGLKIKKENKEYIEERIHHLAEVVDLRKELLDRNISELSGGQQQRVAIARALANKPEILAMDEPLSNLDAKLRKQLRAELKRIQREIGMTTIYVTHDQEEALTISDRIAVFNNGVIEQVGTPSEIYNEPTTEFVCNFIGNATELTEDFVSKQLGLDTTGYSKFYIRPEKIDIRRRNDGNLSKDEFVATVKDFDFYGTFIDYHFSAFDINFLSFEKQDGADFYSNGEEIILSIDPKNVLRY